MREERPDHTLQPTALVHEVYMRLVDQTRVDWKGRTHFLAVASQTIRRVLIDHARCKNAAKRGGHRKHQALTTTIAVSGTLDVDLLALHEAINRLTEIDARAGQIVELRFFGGLTTAQVAETLGCSVRLVGKEWSWARAWLRTELEK